MSDEDNKKEVQRTSSDVLLEIENKLDHLFKMISVYDMNTKLILDRVNKIYSLLNSSQTNKQSPISSSVNEPIKNEITPTPINYGEFISSKLNAEQIKTELDDVDFKDKLFDNSSIPISETPIVNKRNQISKQSSTGDKKYPIQQRVVNSTGQNIFMGKVEILSEDGTVVHKVNTNATGKWTASLLVGNYKVNIVKTDTATKKQYQLSQNITIEPSDVVIQLPTAIMRA